MKFKKSLHPFRKSNTHTSNVSARPYWENEKRNLGAENNY